MDTVKSILADAKKRVAAQMEAGFAFQDIPELAEMVEGIKALEACQSWLEDEGVVGEDNETKWLLKRLASEIDAAQLYYDKWVATGEPHYKTIAKDEARHAEGFINLARPEVTTPEEKAHLQDAINRYSALIKALA